MSECICKGNWRSLVEEYGPQIGKIFIDHRGEEWKLVGLIWADDDYYYDMWHIRDRAHMWYSCVGGLVSHLFRPDEAQE